MLKPKRRKLSERPAPAGPGAALWSFSLALYGKPGIAPALTRLQDRNGLDVNLLLLCCFVGACGLGALTKAQLIGADRAIRAWREAVVQPLRSVRRALKLPPLASDDATDGELRRQVMQAELLSESRAQALLAAWLETRQKNATRGALVDVALSLQRYASLAKVRLDREGRAALELLATAALS
jgi:uncharacterized protein (TIGR02444 family)